MNDPRDEPAADSDNRLLQRSRDGDRHAFSELWRRHAPVAVAYARSLGPCAADAEDLVSAAFLSILQQLRSGGGPQRSFRPYLLTSVRNEWMTCARRTPPTTPIHEAEHPPATLGAIDVDALADSATITEAFGSLPERWQHALWLSAVEQLPPRRIAEVLRIRPNSAAALTYRARDALRKAWIRAHLRTAPEGTDHARVIELLGAYAHDDLPPRSERFVTAHLTGCSSCREAASEARRLARAMSLGPLLAGGAGLVLAPTLFPVDQAAATIATGTGASAWTSSLPLAAQPAAEAAGHAAPLLWPAAAAAAVVMSVGGFFAHPVGDPEAGLSSPAPTSAPDAVSTAPPDDASAPAEDGTVPQTDAAPAVDPLIAPAPPTVDPPSSATQPAARRPDSNTGTHGADDGRIDANEGDEKRDRGTDASPDSSGDAALEGAEGQGPPSLAQAPAGDQAPTTVQTVTADGITVTVRIRVEIVIDASGVRVHTTTRVGGDGQEGTPGDDVGVSPRPRDDGDDEQGPDREG
ncbi:sigma-70 family RNA polymerase sigma factor [Streptomyces sp. AC495_CC817]|uniref:sigma-70 family RNA polymerase sigma factor n=1 Tax=Streptomyces sp. AC495_CC817 TaxID=2823900 RepID=UPI001C279D00|nr:sigma-70 family RNA polymerase sigma factor [Streptomyces sp. AC495_CC817]